MVETTKMKSDMPEQDMINRLRNNDIPVNYIQKLVKESHQAKKPLYDCMHGKHTVYFPLTYTEQGLRNEYPVLTGIIQDIVDIGYDSFSLKEGIIIKGKNNFKLSRVLSKKLTEEMITDRLLQEIKIFRYSYNTLQDVVTKILAKLGDILKPKTGFITISPFQFLMVNDYATYCSCFNYDGEYFNSTIAYCRDNFTVLTGVIGSSGDKIGRCWTYLNVNDYTFTMSRIYGAMSSLDQKNIAQKVKEIFYSDNSNVEWDYVENIASNVYHTGYHSIPYLDGNNITYSVYINGITAMINNGQEYRFKQAICLECGIETDYEQGGFCDDCSGNSDRYTCEECGNRVHEDYTYYSDYDNCMYCEDCYHRLFTTCNNCDSTLPQDDVIYTEDTGNGYCEHCINKAASYCDECSKYFENDYFVTENGDVYCVDCAKDKNIGECENCNEIHELSKAGFCCDDCQAEYNGQQSFDFANNDNL